MVLGSAFTSNWIGFSLWKTQEYVNPSSIQLQDNTKVNYDQIRKWASKGTASHAGLCESTLDWRNLITPAGYQLGQFIRPLGWKHLKSIKALVLYLNILNLALRNTHKTSNLSWSKESGFIGWKKFNQRDDKSNRKLCSHSNLLNHLQVWVLGDVMRCWEYWGHECSSPPRFRECGVWFTSTEIRTGLRGE